MVDGMGGSRISYCRYTRHPFRMGIVLMIMFGHPVTKRKVFEWILALVVTAGVGFLLAFVIINLLLGCETWDESLWTETNSCLTINQLWEGETNHD